MSNKPPSVLYQDAYPPELPRRSDILSVSLSYLLAKVLFPQSSNLRARKILHNKRSLSHDCRFNSNNMQVRIFPLERCQHHGNRARDKHCQECVSYTPFQVPERVLYCVTKWVSMHRDFPDNKWNANFE